MAFNRDNRSGGGRPASRQGGRDFGRRSFNGNRGGERQMFKTICSNCGKDCEVPFQPTGSKPVYCRDCFRTMGGADSSRRSDDRGSRKPSFDQRGRGGSAQPQYKEQFEALNAKLDKILKLLNPQKPMEAPVVVVQPKKEATVLYSVENAKPVKKKTKAKKLVAAVAETPTETPVE